VKNKPKEIPKYLKWEERERHIVERSVEYFSLNGLEASTRDIATYVGVAQSLLYRYFPTKQALIDRVFHEVFFSTWKSEWAVNLKNRERPLRHRLIDYLVDYTDTILTSQWIRIFLFGALAGTSINDRFIKRLQEETFTVILDELYHEHKIPLPRPAEDRAIDLEIVWGFHSSFFYIGVRRWVYNLPVPEDLRPLIRARVNAFLDGVGKELSVNRP
jgi:AcrR family transcriptional regulator